MFNDSTLTDTLKQIGPLESNAKYYWRVEQRTWRVQQLLRDMELHHQRPRDRPGLSGEQQHGDTHDRPARLAFHRGRRQLPGPGRDGQLLRSRGAGEGYDPCGYEQGDRRVGNAARYYWHVRAIVSGVPASYSPSWSFETIVAAPSAPAMLSPADGATGQPVTLQLQWRTSANANLYHVQLSADAAFQGTLLVNDSLLTDTTRAVARTLV